MSSASTLLTAYNQKIEPAIELVRQRTTQLVPRTVTGKQANKSISLGCGNGGGGNLITLSATNCGRQPLPSVDTEIDVAIRYVSGHRSQSHHSFSLKDWLDLNDCHRVVVMDSHSLPSNHLPPVTISAKQSITATTKENTVTNCPTIVDNRPTTITLQILRLLSTCKTNQIGSIWMEFLASWMIAMFALLMKIKVVLISRIVLFASILCQFTNSLINNINNSQHHQHHHHNHRYYYNYYSNSNNVFTRCRKFFTQLSLAPVFVVSDIRWGQICKQILIKLSDTALPLMNKEIKKNAVNKLANNNMRCRPMNNTNNIDHINNNNNHSSNNKPRNNKSNRDEKDSAKQLSATGKSALDVIPVVVAASSPKYETIDNSIAAAYYSHQHSKRQTKRFSKSSSLHLLPRLVVLFALMFSKLNCHLAQISHHQQQQLSQSVDTMFDEIEQQQQQPQDNNNNNNLIDESSDTENYNSDLPKCLDSKSICGYMQINSVGFNKVQICNCKGRNNACPMTWSPLDRTVKHGNDFYKYCNRKPRLTPCHDRQVAYTSYGESDSITFGKLMDVQRMHCLCPANYILKSNQTMFKEAGSSYIYGAEYLCQKKPRCGRRQTCLSITETSDTTLEKQHCGCPAGKICPRDVRLAYEQESTARGVVFSMRCI